MATSYLVPFLLANYLDVSRAICRVLITKYVCIQVVASQVSAIYIAAKKHNFRENMGR